MSTSDVERAGMGLSMLGGIILIIGSITQFGGFFAWVPELIWWFLITAGIIFILLSLVGCIGGKITPVEVLKSTGRTLKDFFHSLSYEGSLISAVSYHVMTIILVVCNAAVIFLPMFMYSTADSAARATAQVLNIFLGRNFSFFMMCSSFDGCGFVYTLACIVLGLASALNLYFGLIVVVKTVKNTHVPSTKAMLAMRLNGIVGIVTMFGLLVYSTKFLSGLSEIEAISNADFRVIFNGAGFIFLLLDIVLTVWSFFVRVEE